MGGVLWSLWGSRGFPLPLPRYSLRVVRWSCLRRVGFTDFPPASIADRAYAKNLPPASFLNAAAKETYGFSGRFPQKTGDGGGLRDSLDSKTFGRSSHVLASALYTSAAQCGPSGKDTAGKD